MADMKTRLGTSKRKEMN